MAQRAMLKNNCFAFKKYLWYVLRVQLSNKLSKHLDERGDFEFI